jgi:hypothetical protein
MKQGLKFEIISTNQEEKQPSNLLSKLASGGKLRWGGGGSSPCEKVVALRHRNNENSIIVEWSIICFKIHHIKISSPVRNL